jgi:hypothetical protein
MRLYSLYQSFKLIELAQRELSPFFLSNLFTILVLGRSNVDNRKKNWMISFVCCRDIQLQSLRFFKAVKIPKNSKYAWKFIFF